ncbi:peptidase C40 [Pasteurellaceae bacterium Macca]|nr:peptidase C40 [Pasteurellaceae bacterium Macca]
MQKRFLTFTKTFSTAVVLSGILLAPQAMASLSTKAATPTQLIKATAAPEALAQSKATVSTSSSNQKVLSAYRQWAGTRYRLGGTSHSGIDCSAFVRATMSSAFNLHLPRSTMGQKTVGRSISKSELRPGDLVFFRKNHHVGVYIGGGKFVHASSSRGVTTSSLSEGYWTRNYTQSRRVL